MIRIKNLKARVEDTLILNGIDLEVKAGEVHAIMGPNGAGKSTLGYVLSGREGYQVDQGSALLNGQDLLELEAEERARSGLFLAFQYPVEIPGVSNLEFLKAAVDAHREAQDLPAVSSKEFLKMAREACNQVNLPVEFLKRASTRASQAGKKSVMKSCK